MVDLTRNMDTQSSPANSNETCDTHLNDKEQGEIDSQKKLKIESLENEIHSLREERKKNLQKEIEEMKKRQLQQQIDKLKSCKKKKLEKDIEVKKNKISKQQTNKKNPKEKPRIPNDHRRKIPQNESRNIKKQKSAQEIKKKQEFTQDDPDMMDIDEDSYTRPVQDPPQELTPPDIQYIKNILQTKVSCFLFY